MDVLEYLGGCDDLDEGWCFNVYINNDTADTYVVRHWDYSGVTKIDKEGLVTELTISEFESFQEEMKGVRW